MTAPTVAGIILAGGRASRVGGADKALFEIDGMPLLTRAVEALSACDDVVIVGPSAARPTYSRVRWLHEDPPFAGPVAALSHAIANTDAEEIILLAADLPGAAEAVELLRAAELAGLDGIVLEDGDGMPQWLTARYRTAALADSIRSTGSTSMRGVVAALNVRRLPAPASATADIDTYQDLDRAKGTS